MAITMYIDQPGATLNRETTHPHFNEHFKASFIWMNRIAMAHLDMKMDLKYFDV